MSEGSRDGNRGKKSSTFSRVGSPPLVVMGSNQYNIEDEAWADTMDPKTGSVFYVDPSGDPEPAPKPPGSPLLMHHSRTNSAGEPNRATHERSPKWGFRKLLTSVGSPSRRSHDDTDLNSISEPDLRGSPKMLRSRHKHVNPFSMMHNGSVEPHTVPNVPTTPTLAVHINLQQLTKEWKPCCLKTLGIIPVKLKLSGSAVSLRSPSKQSSHDLVIVKDLLPDSVVSKKLFPGDCIVSVNGNEVNHSNIDVVLAKVGLASHELVLQVMRESSNSSSSSPAQPSPGRGGGNSSSSELVKLLTRKGSHLSLKPVNHLPHLVMYLTLNTAEDDEENKDILYMYPTTMDSATMNKLYHLRALCLTLTDVMTSSVASGDCSCTTINVDGQLMSLVTIQYDKEMMMLALPALSCGLYEIKSLAVQVEKVLCLLFQSPQSAFSSSKNKQQLDYLFGLLFEQLFTNKKSSSLQSFHFSPTTSLPVNLKIKVSCALTSMDSADFSSQSVFMHTPRCYSSLGSCIFHKGCLLCSHLPFDDLKDVVLFSVMHSLLKVTSRQKISQLVIWRKVYLRRLQQQKCDNKSCFMLAVGLGHTIVFQLMEASSSRANQNDTYINMPDAISIDKTRSLIMELDAKGILDECESCYTSGKIPCLLSIDTALLTNLRSGTVRQSASMSITDLDEVANAPPSPTKSKGSFIGIGSKRKTLVASWSAGADFPVLRTKQPYMLTTGLENVLFHYVSLDWAKGVFISPAHIPAANSHLHEAMLDTFGKTCTRIQETWLALENQPQDDADPDNESDEDYTTVQKPILEQGVLVQCPMSTATVTDKHSKNIPKLFYWVVGRRLPESGKEFYVCFQDNVPQNAVELAFRLHFGSVN